MSILSNNVISFEILKCEELLGDQIFILLLSEYDHQIRK